jgi:putative transposase
MKVAEELGQDVGIRRACEALDVPRASFYRRAGRLRKGSEDGQKLTASRGPSPRELGSDERQQVRETLYSERFMDKPPRQVYATLLDEGMYLCSVRTMYRILGEDKAVKERRNQLRHPNYRKPELLATGPNQVWSWDITKLLGPQKWTYFYLYVILDIFSRYVVGWMLAHQESAELASRLIRETIAKQNVSEDQLTIHSDRGPSMASQTVAQLLATLGVTKSHSRPHVSNDNPFSESQFKTMKYRPEFPDRFGGHDDAHGFCRRFFPWYNEEHYHSGIGLVTPAMLHHGQADQVIRARQQVLLAAYTAHPDRFVQGPPKPPPLPDAVWINQPKEPSWDNPAHKKRLPEIHCPQKPDAPLAHPRPGYPLSGCVPAEPDSVSPGVTKSNGSPQHTQPLWTPESSLRKSRGSGGRAPREQIDMLRAELTLH